ncbi:piezo-type mechanosensitive ion channel component isoform X2 [Athalia rosae]|uniref:piezo-type mechanosensitive ion channel component isoform X2 n=1 Tax=Athalia rosae TaxID=37344 RepID=UPI002033D06A|nr:piezo-type mechanosensitive ion channel component isoform X2 [Athalia rosae]
MKTDMRDETGSKEDYVDLISCPFGRRFPSNSLVGAVCRPVGLSAVYLALMLYLPMVPIPSSRTMNGPTGRFLISAMGLCFLTVVVQITFQFVLLALPPYGHFLENCKFVETLLRHVGLVRLDGATTWMIFYWLTPELISLPSTILVYVFCRRLTFEPNQENDGRCSGKEITPPLGKIIDFLGAVGTYVVLFSLCCVGVLQPSIEGGLYFLVFIGAGTLWACNKELRRGFAIICRLVMVFILIHVILILTYQNPWPQKLVPPDSAWSRYFAFIPVFTTNCTSPRDVKIEAKDWIDFTEPAILIWLYYILALQSQFLTNKPAKKTAHFSGKLETLDTPLSRHVSARRRTPSQRWQSARRKARLMRFGSGRAGLLQDSTGSVIVQDGHRDDSIQLHSLSDGVVEDQPGMFEQIIMAFYAIFQLIIQSSYLATNIVMMAWSITYHSWTTFVLLLWAIILWMVPNKRSWMMKCSPFIVIYATLLLIGQFIFNLNLTKDELPDTIYGIEFSQIGFTKTDELGSWNLLVKCLYTTMFWITMKQYMIERKQLRRSSALRDMVAPLHVSVSTATNAMNQDMPEIRSKFMKNVGTLTQKILTKFWIGVVAIMLFTSGITGERMTVFRIIYMSLFLIFVVTFQISWFAWRRMMYGFWITVIAYSVIMLILVYTYQFHHFPQYWTYIYINEGLQNDIGLEIYETKDLFVRLLTPTFFVIITVVQMHYFHQDFLKVTDIEKIRPVAQPIASDGTQENIEQNASSHIEDRDTNPLVADAGDAQKPMYTLKQLKRMSKIERKALLHKIGKHLYNFYNHVWLFLEIHMEKIIFLSMMLMCVEEVCAIHSLFVVAIVIIINFRRGVQIVAIKTMAAAIAILMVVKMLYQIEYIDHNNWNVNCTETNRTMDYDTCGTNKTVYNIAEWIGMEKAEPSNLPFLLRRYIGIITVTTFRAIILVRQMFYRQMRGDPLKTPHIMFPNISRKDADTGMVECLKFFFNYGFYKFGLEFCFIGIIALISTRLDFYSVLYAIWLGLLYCLRRPTVSKVWPIFQCFTILFLVIQYFIVVAPPTWLCIQYPWGKSEFYRRLQDWMFFPDPDCPPNPKKLICDFFLLLMITRQRLVFHIEVRQKEAVEEYPGGHNYSVFLDIEKPHFVNPASDFVSQTHTWLDVIKRGILSSLLWISLSIMFLAGTKRTNLFSLGYLVGAFVFLWQGSDFYLRPIRTILKWWNVLIGYNIVVITLKAILQGIGCVYIKEVEGSACWLVQLLGIACLKKFKSSAQIDNGTCQVPREDIGMVWDGLCFAFLIMQKRLFKSYYFFHIIDETKAMSILASRGAELLEELHQKRIEKQESIEKTVLEKLKFKMDKIKANQKKIMGPVYKDSVPHRTGTRPLYRRRPPITNREAVRSGDYYMFDDMDDDDVSEFVVDDPDKEQEEKQRRREPYGRRMTISELVNTVLKTDIEIATHVALHGGTQQDALQIRRRSEPLTRKKSSMSYLSARSESDTAAPIDERDDAGSTDSAEAIRGIKGEDVTQTPIPSDEEDEKAEEKKKISIFTYFKFIWAIVNSTIVSMTKRLNVYSRDYRYIRKVLTAEKKVLKQKPDFRTGTRLGISQIWQPITKTQQVSSVSTTDDTTNEVSEEDYRLEYQPCDFGDSGVVCARKASSLTVPHIRILAPSLERGLDMSSSSSSSIISHTTMLHPEEGQGELSEQDQPPIIQLFASIWFAILAHSNLLCYFMVFLHQIKNASVLSLPLPLMVFLWGTLTIPRPSKTFWVTLIAYTEIVVIIKCMFQLTVLPWNRIASSDWPFFPPRIIGIERKENYALWDLLLLLIVFFHRLMLKSLGQWNTVPVKPRKIIPSQIAMAVAQPTPANDVGQGEHPATKIDDVLIEEDTEIRRGSLTTSREKTQHEPTPEEDSDDRARASAEDIESHEDKLTVALGMKAKKYVEPMRTYFENILNANGKERTNVYAYMFFCDFFNFLLIIFGFSAFGTQQGDGGVTAYLAENRVPMPFLLMLLLQFALIVIDRALFLRKYILGKLIFQYCLVIGIHLWMFFILPSVTERKFNDKLPPQIWYMVKCFYLLLAAYQLRLGYPTRILGNFLCKKYSIVNYCLFKVFMIVPFLFELRAVMDWIWTDTSMTIMDWFKMEDIFASIYQLKCMRGVETDFPQPRGIKKQQTSKYMTGGIALFLIIGIIWFPLLLFALGGTVGVSNLPYEVSLKLRIGSFEPIYAMSAQNSSIYRYTYSDYEKLRTKYERDRSATTFLENYIHTDVAAVELSVSSRRLWAISPPDLKRLEAELTSMNIVTMHVEWTVSRKTDAKDASETTTTQRDIELPPLVDGKPNPLRISLLNMLINQNLTGIGGVVSSETIVLPHAFPKFLKVTDRLTDVVPQLMDIPGTERNEDDDSIDYLYRDMKLKLSRNGDCCAPQQWWIVEENRGNTTIDDWLNSIPQNDPQYIVIFVFNDKAFPKELSFISGFGILGLYTTAVVVISQMLRRNVSEMAPKIMFEDLPYVDRILRLCLDIYLVRESGELCLEEDLFAKLIFLYRSPETLIRWTRPPEPGEQADENDDENVEEDADMRVA